jgi:nucleolar protein 56
MTPSRNSSEESEHTSPSSSRVIAFQSLTLTEASEADIKRAQLGLAHQYSREMCATDVNRQDKPIIQTIALIEQMDKNINTFCMRLREWFSWHFPEIGKIVSDNNIYSKLVHMIEKVDNVNEDMKEKLVEILLDEEKAD